MRRALAILLAVAAVATPARADAPSGTYVDKMEGGLAVVLDTRTGLTWLRDASPYITIASADAWCAAKGAGWVVPSYPELATIYDETRDYNTVAMFDPVHFPSSPRASYWTSSRTRPAGFPLTIGFDGVGAGLNDRDSMLPVRCVKRP
jgi:hypothetical protein